MNTHAAVVDLRQYTLVPGGRDALIELFDEHFADGQEAVGIHVVGQFRDLDDPDRFVWLRGFESMAARSEALPSFYHGPVWQQHRAAANSTMLDSDDALLLEPLYLGPGYPEYGDGQAISPTESLVAITVAYLAGPITATDRLLADGVRTTLSNLDAEVVALFTSHEAENNFPALPLRDEHVLVWITRFSDDAAHAAHRERLAGSDDWRDAMRQIAVRSNQLPMQHLRLRPTPRSQLR